MDLDLRDKVVLVTGASHGLGKAIALMLAEEGAKVGVHFRRSPERAEALVREIATRYGTQAVSLPGDVSQEADVVALFDRLDQTLGTPHALVNNAAFCPVTPTADMTAEEFHYTLAVNLTGTFTASREMIRRLLAAGRRGMIVNISSQAAFRGSMSGKTAYDASKMGIIGFTISLAREMAPHGIHVNCVAPGMMYTEMLAEAIDADPDKYHRRAPLGRIATTEEVAGVAVFLCSRRASYMTGATVDVSGGLAMH